MNERMRPISENILSGGVYVPLVPVEYDPMDFALPEAVRIGKRLREYMLAQPVSTDDWRLLFGEMSFDGSVPSDLFHRTGHEHFWNGVMDNFYKKYRENLVCFEWQHSTPNYSRIVERGIRGCLDDIASSRALHHGETEKLFYLDGVEQVCLGMIDWAHKCADACRAAAENAEPERKAELLRAADDLYTVPEFPAKTFRQAIQTVYICFDMLPDSIGTVDRVLEPYYTRDIENGTLTRAEAVDLVQAFYLRLQDRTAGGDERKTQLRGAECHFAIGGYLPNGSDGFSDFSRLLVESLMALPQHIPEMSLRWTKKTPREVLRFMLDCERNDPYKRIALVNDEPRIEGFMKNLGISRQEAVQYTMVGCNEPAFQGAVWMGGNTANGVRSITDLLYDRSAEACACPDFESFFNLWREEFRKNIQRILWYCNQFNAMRAQDINVLSAFLLDGCIESAQSPTRGGCSRKLGGFNLMGISVLIDSLSCVKQFVYDERVCTMEHLIETLRSNWESDPDLRRRIMKTARYFGNNDPLSDEIAVRVTDALHDELCGERLLYGERILVGTLNGYNFHNAVYGNASPATPDGRMAGDPFPVGSGQSFGRDREGVTALLASVAQMQPSGILCGPFLLNVLLDEKLIRQDEYFEKTVDEIEAYFRMGGMHIQLNYVSKEDLLAAREYPDKYRAMKVRVSGWSGVFVLLDDDIQNDVIARTVKEC